MTTEIFGLKLATEGDIVGDITIEESNRATNFLPISSRLSEIKDLVEYAERVYTSKGVPATVVALKNSKPLKCAVYVRNGFLIDVDND